MNILPKFARHAIDKIEALIHFDIRNFSNNDRYEQFYPEYEKTGMTPFRHFMKHGWKKIKAERDLTKVSKNILFDEQYYLRECEGNTEGLNPVTHYATIGWKKGYNPSADFDSIAYILLNPDMIYANTCPLTHYLSIGKRNEYKTCTVKDALNNKTITEEDINKAKMLKTHSNKTALLISHESSLTGAPRAILNMGAAMRKMGITPFFLSFKDGKLKEEAQNLNIPYKAIMPFYRLPYDYAGQRSAFSKFVDIFDYTIINTIDIVECAKYIKDTHTLKISWIHEGTFGFSCYPQKESFSQTMSLFDKILAVGEYSRQITQKHIGNNPVVGSLLYGIDDTSDREEKHTCNHNKIQFIIAGSIEHRKGHHLLLDALRILPKETKKMIEIYVIGGTIEKKLAKKVKKSSNDCLHYVGQLPHNELIYKMKDMDVLLCPSLDDPMPIVCTEAMMLSKPIVVSKKTGTASLVTDEIDSFVMSDTTAEALADSIAKVVLMKERLTEIGKNARSIYEKNFTNEIFSRNIKDILQK